MPLSEGFMEALQVMQLAAFQGIKFWVFFLFRDESTTVFI